MNISFVLTLSLCLVWLVSAEAGELVFDHNVVEIEAAPGEEVVTADFPFHVTGKESVTLKRVEVGCSCLSAQVTGGRMKWGPGEKGVVKIAFKVGNFRGKHPKDTSILMADGQRHNLTMSLTVPEMLIIEPKTLKWEEGKPGEKKAFDIKINKDFSTKILKVAGTDEKTFPSQLETIKEGSHYKLWVTPTATNVRGFARVSFTTDSQYKKHQTYQAFMVITKGKMGK